MEKKESRVAMTVPEYCNKDNCSRYGLIQVSRDRTHLSFPLGSPAASFCFCCKHFTGMDLHKKTEFVDAFRGNMINQIIWLNTAEMNDLDSDMYEIIPVGVGSKFTKKISKCEYIKVLVRKRNHDLGGHNG